MSIFSPDTSQHLSISSPGAVDVPAGPYTVASLFRNIAFSATQIWEAYEPDNFSHLNLFTDGDLWVDFSSCDTNLDISSPIWRWIVVTKDNATEAPGIHVGTYTSSGSMTWTHDVLSAAKPGYGDMDRFCLGDEFGSGMRGDMAVLTAFTSEFTNLEIEARFVRSSLDILAITPQFFTHWPESLGIDDPFVDLAGGGVEVQRSGAWEVSDDPPGFDFLLGRSGKPKVYNGSSWVTHQGKVFEGSDWVPRPISGFDGTDFVLSK